MNMLHKPRVISLQTSLDSQDLTSCHVLRHVKPFVSLDVLRTDNLFTVDEALISSDSGTAIITFLISGEASFSDSTHKHGSLKKGDVLWMLSGSGIQYSLTPKTPDCVGVKLRVALSPALESAPAQSIYLDSFLVDRDGPAQIVLGQHRDVFSQLALPALINYLVVTLAAGQTWVYEPPVNHRTAWIATLSGTLKTSGTHISANQIAVYENANKSISFMAEQDCVFLLGTSQEYTHDFSVENHPVSSLNKAIDSMRFETHSRAICI